MLTDIVSLVRFTLQQDEELVPFRDQVEERFTAWLERSGCEGRALHARAVAVAHMDEGRHRQ